jgi:hypothetical protein
MDFQNRTPWDVRVSTDVLSSEWIVVEVTTLVPWTLTGALLEETVKLREEFLPDRPLHHLEPDRRHVLDVTLCGPVRFARAVTAAELTLYVDEQALQASLSGPRTWVSSGGRLVPSAARPTQEIDLGWGNALGGCVKRPPGLVPYTNLPSPSFEESWSENPAGIGFYGRPAEAEGRPVPGIERVDAKSLSYDALGRSWSFAGLPVGTSHALEHVEADDRGQLRSRYPGDPSPRARLSCKAPPWLRFDATKGIRRVACQVDGAWVFDWLTGGEAVVLRGFFGDVREQAFLVPRGRSVVGITPPGCPRFDLPTTLVAMLVDADAKTVSTVEQATLEVAAPYPDEEIALVTLSTLGETGAP